MYPKITLEAARVNAKLTQAEASKRLGVNRATLHNYDSGKTIPDWEMVKKFEEIYQFPADYIFFGKSTLKA